MTLPPMYADMGLSVAQGVAGFVQGRIASKLAGDMQKYRNQMLELTAAMTRDTITQNQIATRDASVRAAWAIETASAKDKGAAEVAAAAAGVKGGSVDRQMRGLRRSAQMAHAARKRKRDSEFRAHAQDKRNVAVGATLGRDITVNSKPSMLSSVMGIGTSLVDDFDRHQPEGDKIGDRMKRWWEQ